MTQELTQDQIKEFVFAAHGDFEKVKSLLAQEPRLLKGRYLEFDESGLEAASHVGNRQIAEYLLSKGETLTICSAAMLGLADQVAEFLEADPSLANARGAHGISLMFHAALSGNTIVTDLLIAHGGGEGLDQSLHAAVRLGHLDMTRWLLERGADLDVKNFQGKTPLEVALEQDDAQIVELLQKHSGA